MRVGMGYDVHQLVEVVSRSCKIDRGKRIRDWECGCDSHCTETKVIKLYSNNERKYQ